MHSTAIPVENAVPVLNLHLHHVPGNPPIFLGDFLARHIQDTAHALLVFPVKRYGGLAMTAETATATAKYFLYIRHQ